eukprot:749708-Pyramimonas_sp.AAC.1
MISWRPGKVARRRRPPPAAEVSATVNTESELTYARVETGSQGPVGPGPERLRTPYHRLYECARSLTLP